MLKHRNRLIAAVGAVAAAVGIALSGMMAASASPGHAGAAVSGTEKFQIMSTSATSATQSVIAYGVFTAPGTSRNVTSSTGRFVFPDGTVTVKHSPGTGTQKLNPKTCLLTVNLKGTFTITGGTGTYAGISGSGTYTLSILSIGQRSGGQCSKTKPPLAFHQVINATGSVTL